MANVEQSKIMAGLKKRAAGAFKQARKEPPKPRGQGGFPPNLKNLVSKATEYKLDKTKTKEDGSGGDPYFSLTTIVVDPPEYKGRRAVFSWFLNENQYATFDDNVAQLVNDLSLVLADDAPADIDEVPAAFQSMIDNGMHILFNTGGPRTNGRAPNLYIQGPAEGFGDGESNEDSEDAGEDQEEEEGASEEESDEDGAEAGGDEEEWVPAADDEYSVKLKGQRKAYNCKVTAVDESKSTVKVKMLDGPSKGKIFAGIAWTALEGFIE